MTLKMGRFDKILVFFVLVIIMILFEILLLYYGTITRKEHFAWDTDSFINNPNTNINMQSISVPNDQNDSVILRATLDAVTSGYRLARRFKSVNT